ncbi:MAG: hypothetical protein Q9170_002085 [Blastenia crenularia]
MIHDDAAWTAVQKVKFSNVQDIVTKWEATIASELPKEFGHSLTETEYKAKKKERFAQQVRSLLFIDRWIPPWSGIWTAQERETLREAIRVERVEAARQRIAEQSHPNAPGNTDRLTRRSDGARQGSANQRNAKGSSGSKRSHRASSHKQTKSESLEQLFYRCLNRVERTMADRDSHSTLYQRLKLTSVHHLLEKEKRDRARDHKRDGRSPEEAKLYEEKRLAATISAILTLDRWMPPWSPIWTREERDALDKAIEPVKARNQRPHQRKTRISEPGWLVLLLVPWVVVSWFWHRGVLKRKSQETDATDDAWLDTQDDEAVHFSTSTDDLSKSV